MQSILLLLFLSVPASHADWKKISAHEFSLPPPPADGSAAAQQDMEQLKKYQITRTAADCAQAAKEPIPSFYNFFENEQSPLSGPEQKTSEDLGSAVMKLAEKAADVQKNKYPRARPYDEDASVQPCVTKPGGDKSYPSSHAAAAAAAACVLAAVFPEKAPALRDYGDHLGELRAIVGVHHPSDVAAGQTLGRAVCDRLLKESDFQEELEEVVSQTSR